MVIRKGKDLKIRKIKDDTLVDTSTQELKINFEQIEKEVTTLPYAQGNL